MKKIIFLLVISCLSLYSQDFEPNQIPFRFGANNNYYLSADSTYFKQNDIILGWVWGFGKKMSEAMLDNQAHVSSGYPQSWIKNNTNLIINTDNVWDNGYGSNAMNSQSICYSPVLQITNPGSISNIRPNDPRNSVFGFQYINGETIESNDWSLKLRTTGSYVNDSVLSSPWSNNQLYFMTYLPSSSEPSLYWRDSINTVIIYFVINLRRANPADTIKDDTPVLKIKLPYILSGDTNNIQFSKQPSGIPDSTYLIITTLGINRGIARKLIVAPPGTREFNITRNMLPVQGDYDSLDITISAEFKCDGDTVNNNPKLNREGELGIEIYYLGGSDVNINHIYFATPWARDLYFGKRDSIIKANVQTDLDHYTTSAFADSGCKPFRFFTRDEINASYFGAVRYFNKFVGNIGTTQSALPYPNLYFYNTLSPDDWIETQRIDPSFAVPYFKNQRPNDKKYLTFNIFSGYEYLYGTDTLNINDTLNSGYETHLIGEYPLENMKTLDSADFLNKLINSHCFQAYHERFIFDNVKDEKFIPLFSDKPWWGELFVGSNFNIYSDRATLDYNRPKTGEEIRLGAWNNLILGAKGLLYDRECSDPDHYYWFGLGKGQDYYTNPLDTMNIDAFINSDDVGRDFLNTEEDFENFQSFIAIDSTAEAMGIDENRIYLGRKSPRTELKKIHTWIREVEDTLMNLRLSAWYGKGYKLFQNQDYLKYGSQLIMNNYINLDTVYLHTRKIYDPRFDTFNNPKERWDSSFFDISLFRSAYDTNMSNLFFVG